MPFVVDPTPPPHTTELAPTPRSRIRLTDRRCADETDAPLATPGCRRHQQTRRNSRLSSLHLFALLSLALIGCEVDPPPKDTRPHSPVPFALRATFASPEHTARLAQNMPPPLCGTAFLPGQIRSLQWLERGEGGAENDLPPGYASSNPPTLPAFG